MKRVILIVTFLLFCSFPAMPSYFRSYQVEDGLSHNSVWAVMQDSRGFMWFGTNDGLDRFDGRHFKSYQKRPDDSLSIGNNFIHCLKEDSQGRFLIGTKEGLYLFNPNSETFRRIKLIDNVSINAIMEDPDGYIWLACHGQGIFILNPDLSLKKHYYNRYKKGDIPANYIWSIVQDYSGGIWLGTASESLIYFDQKSGTFSKIMQAEINDPTVFSLYCDTENNIWIGTASKGLFRYNSKSKKIDNFLNQKAFNIKSIIEYSGSELIMGSDKGLVKFDKRNETYDLLNKNSSYDNMTDNSIFSIIKDREGAFWIGTYFGGVNYYSPVINKFFYYYSSPDNSSKKNIISSFGENANGKIWVGTHNNGLSLFDPQNSTFDFSCNNNISYHDVQSLLLDNDKLYISLYGKGVSVLNMATGRVQSLHSPNQNALSITTNIFKSSKGEMYFSSEEGVSYMEPMSLELKRLKRLNGVPVKDIMEDYNGSLWFASHANGLLRLYADGKWVSYVNVPGDKTSLVTDNVNCIFQDSKFRIWVGTEGGGLMLFNNKKNAFEKVFDSNSGLPSNIIYSILDDAEGNIWITTGGGLVRISSDLENVRTLGYISDLQKIRFNAKCALRSSDNRLYFGGTNGFIAFNPKEITENLQIPPVLITKFEIFNKEIKPRNGSVLDVSISNTKEIVLNYDQSTFSFDFVALSYLSHTHNQYAYKLEGFDNEWIYTSDNKASYMNIPAGEYTFMVKGSNNDGVWNEEPVSIKIIIKPPFWRSNIMIFTYIVLIIGSVFFILKQYSRFLDNKNKEKIYKYQSEKEKEIYESKINFFTNIAHEIRTPLSLIVAPLENIILSGDGNNKTKSNLNIIEQNANRLLELINQLLDFRKIEEDMFHFTFKRQNIVKIIQDVFTQHSQNAKNNNIEMRFNPESENIECVIDSESVYKIINNLISNATKFAKSKIGIEVTQKGEYVTVSVSDDGDGIDKEYQQKIFEPFFQVQVKNEVPKAGSGLGLSLSQSLAVKHGGKITVESNAEEGSRFILTLPVNNEESEVIEEEDVEVENVIKSNIRQTSDTGFKIIVAEDNKDLRSFLLVSLGENYTVFTAGNGIEALSIIDKENIDLIISDIIMPEMDGIELCNTVKSDPAHSHIPFILLSAKTDTSTKIEGLKKGADVYLEKPFSIEQLKAQIKSIIDNRNKIRENFVKSPLQYFKSNAGNNETSEFMEKLNLIILENMSDEKFSIDNLSGQFFMSRSNFHKKIKNMTGMTPNDYIKLIRLNKSAQLLSTGKYKINEVCYLVGFNTPSYFSKCFYDQFGKLPKDFIDNNDK